MISRTARRSALSTLAATALALTASTALARDVDKVSSETVAVPGLQSPAEIIVDQWGIPHIYAKTERDVYFLQGWNAARDRLWQIDFWRKRGLGRLSASFGPGYVEHDRALRLFLYRGDMNAEWAAYGKGSKASTEAFVAGINAYVARAKAEPKLMPIEFRISGSEPETWTAEDVVRIRSHGLTRNVTSEVARARAACAAGLDSDQLRKKLEPPVKPALPPGLDPCSIPAEVLRDYILATENIPFSRDRTRIGLSAPGAYEERLAALDEDIKHYGSNNWTIAPSRTVSGRPILANDPHRAHGVPSLRYVVHLNAPGLNVIGGGEPALPGVSIGHNGTIAFGLTIFAIDQEDLYVYELDPQNPDRYRYKDGFETMRTVAEEIPVKGEASRKVDLKFTRHGPVIHVDKANNRAFAMRATWFEPGASAYFGSTSYMKAKSWPEFRKAMETWGAPSENQVYADVKGNIGWVAGGHTPVRPNWDGLMPVPGDGRYEWAGLRAGNELPTVFNPKEGYFGTANEMNIPLDHPAIDKKIGFEWSNPSRIQRIKEVFATKKKWTLADAMDLQTDPTTPVGRRIAKLLTGLSSDDPQTTLGLNLVRNWDGRTSADSAAAALAEVWMAKHLGRGVVAATTPEAARSIVGAGDLDAIADLLDKPDARFGSDPQGARNRVLLETLGGAVKEVTEILGSDPANWAWGKLHHAQFEHALSPIADDRTRAQLNVSRLQKAGTAFSPMAATYRNTDFRVTAGASFRMVLDVGRWDESVMVNTPGQSGDPASPFYRNLAPFWAAGAYVPLLYSKPAIEAAAFKRYRLTP
ncbi:penicillin acylase 2 precursor [Variibacter gotjawalensis]|uniref:Penicillin acylase 2 n=1 Tax=Variibacter gotjawalensis TaxID=1333996 RepID=A0A0S3PX96_9BRAD|nr:penicillin acylase family protein [Variibacter gotjawalensis]NIK46395.1 penicillin amidase [Variibacter gotjawalensis]RZS48305.1 penicillin amidase [Variibacter gotjawalensis]BAT60565.1 penicillin acylase 2 precursor [Variibacter gotjawalensis]